MSKIRSPVDKETLIGFSLFIGLCVWFVVNIAIVFFSLIILYGGQKQLSKGSSLIDDSTLSKAVKLLRNQE